MGLGVEMVSMNKKGNVVVELRTGAVVTFQEESFDPDERSRVFVFNEISSTIFPGFNFTGSRLYFQVVPEGFFSFSSTIEIGWGVPTEGEFGGNIERGLRLVESLLLQILINFEREFGQVCDAGRNVRTVEGDCNNLENPAQGSASSPLLRFGNGDPAYPRGNPANPAGPVDINAREISNGLFASSETIIQNENRKGAFRSWSSNFGRSSIPLEKRLSKKKTQKRRISDLFDEGYQSQIQ